MKISEHFGGDDQDKKVECIHDVLKFRNQVFDDVTATMRQPNILATTLAHALLGVAHGYKACCILQFCEDTYNYQLTKPKRKIELCPETGAVMCDRCAAEYRMTNGVD